MGNPRHETSMLMLVSVENFPLVGWLAGSAHVLLYFGSIRIYILMTGVVSNETNEGCTYVH